MVNIMSSNADALVDGEQIEMGAKSWDGRPNSLVLLCVFNKTIWAVGGDRYVYCCSLQELNEMAT